MEVQQQDTNNPSPNEGEKFTPFGIFIAFVIFILGAQIYINRAQIEYVMSNLLGGVLVAGIATAIIAFSTDNHKFQNVAFGGYFLGAFFALVVSYMKYGLTVKILLHGSLSWLFFVL